MEPHGGEEAAGARWGGGRWPVGGGCWRTVEEAGGEEAASARWRRPVAHGARARVNSWKRCWSEEDGSQLYLTEGYITAGS